MRFHPFYLVALSVLFSGDVLADAPQPEVSPEGESPEASPAEEASPSAIENEEHMATTGRSSSSGSSSSGGSSAAATAVANAVDDAEVSEGLFRLWHKDGHVYTELTSSHYRNEYIILMTIARGIGQNPLLGGMSWDFGNDAIWIFRKINDNIHVIRKNVRFRADAGSPEATAVEYAYTDSVMFSIPIIGRGPGNGDFIDLTPIFKSDLPGIQNVLSGYSFSASKSTWANVKAYPDNIELQVASTYTSSGRHEIDTVPDTRGVTVNVHYSISKIPSSNSYEPRLADPRVGYFVSAVKDFSQGNEGDGFIRYIQRWNLEKADPSLDISPPKEPIIYWIENTVPFEYRQPIREGILQWNRAFEAVGFQSAIEVRQQPDNADWDPEDINYNTFRWTTSDSGFAIGPSRVNPYTGEILDADVLFDASFLLTWQETYETFLAEGGTDPEHLLQLFHQEERRSGRNRNHQRICTLQRGISQQMAFGMSAILAQSSTENAAEELRKLTMQGLREVAMHEVGHTLGLRHNFKASTWLTLREQNDPENAGQPLSASVMDYLPVNVVPESWNQGDYYTQTIGPYDMWAIEYGYRPLTGDTQVEEPRLREIASRSGEAPLTYGTDGDTRSYDPDPHSNRFDNGQNLLEFARMRAELVAEIMPGLVERMVEEGEDYTQARHAFNLLIARHGGGMLFASRYIGGIYVSRSHLGDEGASPPMQVVDVERQRDTLELLVDEVFSDTPYQIPPELYNHLAPTNWSHWGYSPTARADYPIHDMINMWQTMVLSQLLSSTTLHRLHDSELRVPADEDAFTVAELLERLTEAIFAETDQIEPGDYTNRQPAISSLRRNLHRTYLGALSRIALGETSGPQDCQSIATMQLIDLNRRIVDLLESDLELDTYSRAHLLDTSTRITKVLEARYLQPNP